jgi:mono/diheme cytochrome c family protein
MSREAALLAFALVAACARDWRTDMWYQPARQARETPRPEPAGSVPLFARPHFEDRDDTLSLKSAFPDDDASADRGRSLFLDRCAGCHNVDGHGKGPVGRTFPPAPDLALDTIKAKPDGYLYGTIAMGGRAMPPMGEGFDERDLWDLVHFVRRIQADTASLPPAPERGTDR